MPPLTLGSRASDPEITNRNKDVFAGARSGYLWFTSIKLKTFPQIQGFPAHESKGDTCLAEMFPDGLEMIHRFADPPPRPPLVHSHVLIWSEVSGLAVRGSRGVSCSQLRWAGSPRPAANLLLNGVLPVLLDSLDVSTGLVFSTPHFGMLRVQIIWKNCVLKQNSAVRTLCLKKNKEAFRLSGTLEDGIQRDVKGVLNDS